MEEGLGQPLVSTVPVQWKYCTFALFLSLSKLLEIPAPPVCCPVSQFRQPHNLQEKLKLEAQAHECDTSVLSLELIPS